MAFKVKAIAIAVSILTFQIVHAIPVPVASDLANSMIKPGRDKVAITNLGNYMHGGKPDKSFVLSIPIDIFVSTDSDAHTSYEATIVERQYDEFSMVKKVIEKLLSGDRPGEEDEEFKKVKRFLDTDVERALASRDDGHPKKKWYDDLEKDLQEDEEEDEDGPVKDPDYE